MEGIVLLSLFSPRKIRRPLVFLTEQGNGWLSLCCSERRHGWEKRLGPRDPFPASSDILGRDSTTFWKAQRRAHIRGTRLSTDCCPAQDSLSVFTSQSRSERPASPGQAGHINRPAPATRGGGGTKGSAADGGGDPRVRGGIISSSMGSPFLCPQSDSGYCGPRSHSPGPDRVPLPHKNLRISNPLRARGVTQVRVHHGARTMEAGRSSFCWDT